MRMTCSTGTARDETAGHPGGNPGANLKSISHRCYLFEVAFVWELSKETIVLPLGCLQGGVGRRSGLLWRIYSRMQYIGMQAYRRIQYVIDSGLVGRKGFFNHHISRGEKMALRGTDPESYITEYTLVYEDIHTHRSIQYMSSI